MKSGGNPRRVRVANSIRAALAEMIARQVKDPRVRSAGFININHVELNSDMSVARIYVSFLPSSSTAPTTTSAGKFDSGDSHFQSPAVRRAIAGLQASAGFLRGPLARRLRLRHAPDLRFVADDSPSFQQKLRDVVRADDEARERTTAGDTDRDKDGDTGEDTDGHGRTES